MLQRLLLCLLALPVLLSAQTDLAIGQWKDYLPYRRGLSVTQSAEKVYFATARSVFSIDKADNAVAFLSETDGLSQTGVELVEYNQFSDILLVVYDDAVIDLVKEREIITLTQIRNFQNILGEKRVNDIFVENDSIVYLATSYGVSQLNVRSDIFTFTTQTPLNVEDVIVADGFIYAATQEGIYRVNADNFLIENFDNWQLLGANDGFPLDYSAKAFTIYQDDLYVALNDSLYRYDAQAAELTPIYGEAGFSVHFASAEGEHLLFGMECLGDCNGKVFAFTPEDAVQQLSGSCTPRPIYAIEDAQKPESVWFADRFRNIRHLRDFSQSCEQLSYNSPYSENVYRITPTDDALWIAAGGVDPRFSALARRDGIFLLQDGQWSEFNSFNTPILNENNILDVMDIAVHPVNGKVYAASFFDGVVEIEGENFTVYNDSNSSLNNAVGDASRTRVSGLDFDADNNLWVSNHLAERPISVLKEEGDWQSFTLPSNCNETLLEDVLVDANGYKWFVVGSTTAGLLVYDTGESLEDTRDDRCRLFTTANGLPTNTVNTVELDLDGEIWAGTSEGVVVFNCPDPFESDCQPTTRITDQDEFNLGILLQEEDVRTIAVDGANRKWFGTTNGVFVQSQDGSEQVARFTVDNSPLIDNTITDIAIRGTTGEVFIGTAKGLVSYRGEATKGGRINSPNAYAFPNPVRPDYTGLIAIKGLAENANVKITDVNGQLIFETEALGGQAVWDGTDYNGRKASSGVYLVFSTSRNINNPDTLVTKILILN